MNLYPISDPHTRVVIPGGIMGVRATLKLMQGLVHRGRKDPGVIALAESVTRACPSQDIKCEINTLFQWVKSNIRYVRDPRDVEKINTPERTLRVGCGDCDDMTVLLSSLLEAVGNKTRIVAMGFDDDQYSHVVTQVRLGPASSWLTADPTVRAATLGWTPPNITRWMQVHI